MMTWKTTTKRNACVGVHEPGAHAPDDDQLAIEKLDRLIAKPIPHRAVSILSLIRNLAASRLGSTPSACWSTRTSSADRPAVEVAAAGTETREIRGEADAGNVSRQTPSEKILFRLG